MNVQFNKIIDLVFIVPIFFSHVVLASPKEVQIKIARNKFVVKLDDSHFSFRTPEFDEKFIVSKCNKSIVNHFWKSHFEEPNSSTLYSRPASKTRVSPFDIELNSLTGRWYLGYNTRKGQTLRDYQSLLWTLKTKIRLACSKSGKVK